MKKSRGPWSARWALNSSRTRAPGEGENVTEKTVYLPVSKDRLARGQEPVAAARIGNMVFTSGVPGIDIATGMLGQGAERQFELAFANLATLLNLAGAGLEAVGLLTVFIPDRTNRAH